MYRNQSYTSMQSHFNTPNPSQRPLELRGNMLHKVKDTQSAKWNGLSIQSTPQDSNPVPSLISPKRIQEMEQARRTIDPNYVNDKPYKEAKDIPGYRPNSGSLNYMIQTGKPVQEFRGYRYRVRKDGVPLHPNMTSEDNFVGNYQKPPTKGQMILGDKIIPVDKKFKRINSEWDKKTQSSVNFGEIQQNQEFQPRIRQDYYSQISEIPGTFKRINEPDRNIIDPNIKPVPNKTKIRPQPQQPQHRGPKITIQPDNQSSYQYWSKSGQESQLNPYTPGRQRNQTAEFNLLHNNTKQEWQGMQTRKARPEGIRDAFTSNIQF